MVLLPVRMVHPLKEGLRPSTKGTLPSFFASVRMVHPLKEGLRHLR